MRDAIAEARKQGALIVAAAGNDGVNTDKTPFYPAAYPDSNVLSVAATDDRDKLASFSNYGAKTVDLAAPGDAVGSTYLGLGVPLPVGDEHGGAVRRGGRGHAARAQRPPGTPATLSCRLRQKGDELSALRGKTVFGERLNVNRALG